MRYDPNDADPSSLIAFANAWANLGRAVQVQVEAVLADVSTAPEQNLNALKIARREIGQFNEEIEQILDEAIELCTNPPEEFCDACKQHAPCSCEE